MKGKNCFYDITNNLLSFTGIHILEKEIRKIKNELYIMKRILQSLQNVARNVYLIFQNFMECIYLLDLSLLFYH